MQFFHGVCPTANTYMLPNLAKNIIERVENDKLSRTNSERNFEETFDRIKKENKDLSDFEALLKVQNILNPNLELQSDVESDIESDVESVADEEDVVSEVGSEDDVADDASDAASVILKQHKNEEGKNFDDLFKEDLIKNEGPEPVVEPVVEPTTPSSPKSPRSPKLLLDAFDENTRGKLYKTNNKLWNEENEAETDLR